MSNTSQSDHGARGAVRLARPEDLTALQEIERAAGRWFAEIGMELVAADEPPSVATLGAVQRAGRLWVWADADDRPLAYLMAAVIDGLAHLEQVSVHPSVARRGIGRALLAQLARWAVANHLPAITLTTYTEVAWNGPYYERQGFRYLAPSELTPGLRRIREAEAAHGLDRWPRACMRLEL
ncbi:MAG: GNAT family N-acetyltransferase [Nannocystaceae bacterium]